jgi:hypothetical protein
LAAELPERATQTKLIQVTISAATKGGVLVAAILDASTVGGIEILYLVMCAMPTLSRRIDAQGMP